MDPKASAPETASQLSNSPGSPSYFASSSDSVIDNSVKGHSFEADNNNNSANSNSGSSSSSSSDGGFVSGDEEFETAPERPIAGDPDEDTIEKPVQGNNIGSPFVNSVEFQTPKIGGDDDDDDKGVIGESKVRTLKKDELVRNEDKSLEAVGAEGSVERNGIGGVDGDEKNEVLVEGMNTNADEMVPRKLEVEGSELNNGEAVGGEKTDVYGGEQSVETKEVSEVVEESKILGGAKVDCGILEPENDKVAETDGVKFTGQGDLVVESVQVDLTRSGVAVVGDVEGNKDSDIKGVEVPDDGSVHLDNGFDKISGDVEQPVAEQTVEPVTVFKIEAPEADSNGGEIDVFGAKKDGNLDTGAVIDDAVMKDNQEISEIGVDVAESATVGVINDKAKLLETKVEQEADVETKQIEPAVETAIDGLNVVANDQVYGGDGDRILPVDSIAETAQTFAAHEVEHSENDQTYVNAVSKKLEDEVSGKAHVAESAELNNVANEEVKLKGEEDENEGSVTDGETEGVIFGSSQAAKQFLAELEQGSGVGSHSGAESSHDHSQRIDGQIVTDSEEEVDTDEEGEGKEVFDSAALAALLKAATGAGSDGGTITVTSQDGSRLFSVERPAGLGSSLRSVKPASRPNRPNLFTPPRLTGGGDSDDNLSEEEKKKLENLQQIRINFLRLVHRLGLSPEESIATQVLYRLALVAGRQTYQLFNLDAAKRTALQLEAEGKDDLNFSLNVLVLGKAGVGKSATINSIFGEVKSQIHPFEPATTSVKEITGIVDGVKIRVIDSPGLKSSGSEQGANCKVLSSLKKLMKKCPPDIVLYVDRLDTQTRDLNDLPLLRSITSTLGSSIWRSAIVTLTHAASAPPDGPSGSPLSYEVFVSQRSHLVQQSIGQAVGDLRLMSPSVMNPVSLVENHPSCRKNRDGQKVLPNGQSWRPQLLLLCYSMKILSEASSLSKPQDPFDHRKLFGFRVRSPPLPYLLSWLLQSRTHPKLSTDQGGDNVDSDVDLADLSDSDQEEEDEYDQLPPFKPLRKTQLAKLSKEQRKAYFEEYDYRVKLLQKKQWKEELRRMREIKKKGKAAADEYGYMGEDVDPENGGPAAVPVPLPDMVLPPSFDGDNPAYRYRFLEPTSQFLARPVLDTHGWDHDCGYDGVNIEHSLGIANRFPAAVTVQVTKDKKEFNIHLDSSVSAKHGENGSSMAGFDVQNVGKQLAYILRGETKFKNFKKNKTAAGVSVTFLGENVATGFKLEDQIALGKRLTLVGSTGTVRSQGDAAYGANLEVQLREVDYPIGQDQSSLGLSLVKWRGDLALGANLQSQFSIGRSSKIAIRAGLNNKMSGQITVRTSSSEQIQIALVGLLPIAMAIYKSIRPGVSDNYSMY